MATRPRDSHIPLCRRCGYRLTGLQHRRCSECGTPFDPDNPRTYRINGQMSELTARRIRLIAGWTLALGSMLLTIIVWPLLFFALGAHEAGFISTSILITTLTLAALPFFGIPIGLTLTHEPENASRRW